MIRGNNPVLPGVNIWALKCFVFLVLQRARSEAFVGKYVRSKRDFKTNSVMCVILRFLLIILLLMIFILH